MTALLLFLIEQALDIFRRVSRSSGPDDIIYLLSRSTQVSAEM